ncbi:MAG TPA: tetratricopeptide repeat protein [Phycisphaerae bacterium]|nr:tetratricopeptide repeat protein [Phycisphaerae bacterium]
MDQPGADATSPGDAGRGALNDPPVVNREPGASRQRSHRGRPFLLGALILLVSLLTAATHWPALSAQALAIDDGQYLHHNRLVQHPSWNSTGRFLCEVWRPSTVGGYYQPLSMISLMVDCALGGRPDHLAPFRRTSLALHVLCTVLVVVLLYQLFGQPLVAAMVGLLFGLHPVTIEAIPWMAERKALLTAFFALWCLILYVRYAHRGGRLWYTASLFLYLLAVMAKPTTTPVAALLLLIDYWPLNRLNKRAVIEKIPFFLIAGVFVVITVISQHTTLGIKDPTQGPPLQAPLVLAHNIVFYLVKVVWPVNLAPFYPYPRPLSLANPVVLAGVIGSLLLVVALLISWRWTRALLVGWLFFFVAILPAIGVISFMESIAADRFLYFPAIGFLLTLTWLLIRLWRPGSARRGTVVRRTALVIGVVLLAGAEARATRRYLECWRDTESLARRMVALAPHDSVAYAHLGLAMANTGRTEEAMAAYAEAIRLKPRDSISYYNLGTLLDQQGRTADALQHYTKAIEIDPHNHAAHTALGKSFQFAGRIDDAITHYRRALEANPDYAEAHNTMAAALLIQGDAQQAADHARAALKLEPDHLQAHVNLGRALARLGDTAGATEAFEQALGINPDDPEVHHNFGTVLIEQGRAHDGIRHLRVAVRLDPDYLPAHLALATVLRRQGRLDEAADHLRQAVRIRPDSAELHSTLGVLRLRQDQLIDATVQFRAAVRCDPTSPEAHHNLGRALARQERWDEAVGALQDAVKADPSFVPARLALGKALSAAGRPDEAVHTLRRAIELKPEDARAHFQLAAVLEELGQTDEAAGHYRQALHIDPGHAAAREALERLPEQPQRQ